LSKKKSGSGYFDPPKNPPKPPLSGLKITTLLTQNRPNSPKITLKPPQNAPQTPQQQLQPVGPVLVAQHAQADRDGAGDGGLELGAWFIFWFFNGKICILEGF
jgi:hypothetical protein